MANTCSGISRGWGEFATYIVTSNIRGYEIPLINTRIIKLSLKLNDYYGLSFSKSFERMEIQKILSSITIGE